MKAIVQPLLIAAFAVIATLDLAAAQAWEGEPARLPRPRPAIIPPVELSEWADAAEEHFRTAAQDGQDEAEAMSSDTAVDAATAIEGIAPLPRPRPSAEVLALIAPPALKSPPTVVEADDPDCLDRLRALGAAFAEELPIDPLGECSVAHPLNVTSLGSNVAIGPEAIMTCRVAEQLALWVKESVVPAAQAHFGEAPTGITHSSTYVCRPRNNVAGAKLSEHAHANAVDIAAVNFGDRAAVTIGVNKPESAEQNFEDKIRADSCRYFTTVLGPGSDTAHALHLHFDMAWRRGGYRLCELGAPGVARAP
jgi:hypothetical protein